MEVKLYEGGHGAVAEVDVGIEARRECDWTIEDAHDGVCRGFLISSRI